MNARIEAIRSYLKVRDIGAVLISAPENRRYLSGFSGSNGYLVISESLAVLATDFRYIEQSKQESPDFEIVRIAAGFEWLTNLMAKSNIKNLSFESDNITVAFHERLATALAENQHEGNSVQLYPVTGICDTLRMQKDETELISLAKAIEIADIALDQVAPTITTKDTESDIALRLDNAMRLIGAEKPSFDTIVASGPNGALPHHRPSSDLILEGAPIVIDMGAMYKGYCSDLTRTVFVGQPSEEFKRVYNIVLKAQQTAMNEARAGMSGGAIDQIARQVIEEQGYAEYFGHALGHGVGLAVHEFPRLGPAAPEEVNNSMVFTIEPGIYLPGSGGVRIEDTVIMKDGLVKQLSKARKAPTF
jgi:Xaa-Pro aminopeptidase